MGEVIRKASEGNPMFYVDGAYDFVDVRDVADGTIAAMKQGRCGESYILSGQRISMQYILETVREVSGKDFTSTKIPLPLARLAARFTPWYYQRTKAKPSFTPYALEVLQSNSNISCKKAQTELGYKARPIYESIADTVRWFLENRP
jgi:dihydroflavonol-4-reductase